MYLTICTNCKDERIRETCIFSQTRCSGCGSLAFGLIDYMWLSEDEAKHQAKEKGLEIEK